MPDLQIFNAKICLTVCGVLIVKDHVLLVKHKKLGIWLNPGGHIEANELPHRAAEREYWEETGLRVEARKLNQLEDPTVDSTYLPNPILTNLHWVSQENYEQRVHNVNSSADTKKKWKKGCEQHLNFVYLVAPADPTELDFKQNVEETDGIAWFTEKEVAKLATRDNVKLEVQYAFQQLRTNLS